MEQEKTIKVSSTRDLVKALLTDFEDLRGDDNALVGNVWHFILKTTALTDEEEWQDGYEIILSMLEETMNLIDKLGLPTYDTITRLRRDIQRKNPELKPKEPIQKLRKQKQEMIEKAIDNEIKRNKLNAWLKQGENK